MAALVVLLTLSAQLLFATRRATDRQRLQTEPRQLARGAADYVNYLVRTASDFNTINGARNPMAVMTWYLKGDPDKNPTLMQTSYNNLTAGQAAAGLGDEGTDMLSVAHADKVALMPNIVWQGYKHSSSAYWQFGEGCPDSARNLELFKEITCGDKDCTSSGPLIIVDANGVSAFYEITDYKEGTNANNCSATNNLPDTDGVGCAANQGCIATVANPGQSDSINPPSGRPELARPITMIGGPRFVTLRVRARWLEQKFGLFDSTVDNPGGNFQRLLPNVEDMQVAWIFNNGETRNSQPTTASRLTTTGQVPAQAAGAPGPYDVINVAAMRITVTTRSAEPIPGEVHNRWLRPLAEDHEAATARDQFFRHQLSATSMIRNRWVGR
jgi:hypothetical protein